MLRPAPGVQGSHASGRTLAWLPMSDSQETPSWLKALGREPVPQAIELGGRTHRLERVLKHDFFAYTGLYVAGDEKIILKLGRKASLWGLPLGWIGRLHARHECAVFQQLEDLEVVPRFTGRYGKYGITHAYVEGRDLRRGEHVDDDFFPRLRHGLAEIHRRGMAYVDLEKCENVLVGDDGRPYLFDFQISWYWPGRLGGDLWPLRWIRTRLQQADDYHLTKLIRRIRPDLLSGEELAASRRKPPHVRLHSALTRPFTRLRRRILNRVDPSRKRGKRGERGEQGRIHSAASSREIVP